ncbi:RHS repeat domain-containing protein [Capnocytophaga canimorsus]|uniref:RHS repeat domain-containing protein n=2 Tax=Capnocytophaga canimorsus TaxID=28188 RepID=UPI00385E6953
MRQWTLGSWAYEWNANGSLKSVKKPSGQTISFEYDALGRRTAKRSGNKEILYIWSGNVLLHEVFKTNDNEQVITWVYEQGSFVPTAKLIDGESFSIVSDYIGRPVLAFDSKGEKVWSAEYDIYGKLINLQGDKAFIPFRQLGQYEDVETGLYYNRFRYYDPNTGNYISQDPIGLKGGLAFYGYVHDVNSWVDIFGLRKGGGYSGVRNSNVGGEVNHIPAWKSIELAAEMNPSLQNLPTYGTAPSIHMEKPEHRAMSTTGSSIESKRWRHKQAELISQGKFVEAMEMDIDEAIGKYGKKYNEHINEMIEYAYDKGYINTIGRTKLKEKINH